MTLDSKIASIEPRHPKASHLLFLSLILRDIAMLQIIYLIAFTILAFLAIGNLIRSLIGFSMDVPQSRAMSNPNFRGYSYQAGAVPHPELLDDMGNVTSEPLLIMKSISIEDARAKLDALYHDDRPRSTESEN